MRLTREDARPPFAGQGSVPGSTAVGQRRVWSLRTSFWLVVAAQVLLFAGSNFPTPLFPIYEHRYGFGSGVVTLLFGVYVVALVPTLLLLGRVADRVGRRPVLVAGIAITVLSSVAFAAAQNVGWLFAGEIIYGIGGGLVMSSVAVAIRELHPKQHIAGGALAASVSAAAGLTLGPLVSGLLAWLTPWPTVSPYVLDIVLATALALALVRIPETRPVAPTATERGRMFHIPSDIRPTFLATALAGAASFMVVGWVFAMSPSYLHEQLHVQITQPVVAGLFAALVVFTNGGSQLVLRRQQSALALRTSLVGVVIGMGVMAASTLVNSLAVAIIGGVIAGAGAGVAQMNAMATIQRIVPMHARGGVTSTYFTLCYSAMSVPVIIAGELADRFGLGAVTAGYFVALTLLVGAALVLAHRLVETPATDLVDPFVEPDLAELAPTAWRKESETMKAIGLMEFGGPEVLQVVDLPEPQPGPGELRIRVHAVAVNPTDITFRAGGRAAQLAERPRPYVPGVDVAGVVDKLGQGTDGRLAVGDAVIAYVIPMGPHGGTYAEQVVVGQSSVVRAPRGVTFAEASTLLLNATTALLALDALALPRGSTVAVIGGAGAVGGYAIQLAKAEGLVVLADAAPSDEPLVRGLGADVVIERSDDIDRQIRSRHRGGVSGLIDGAALDASALAGVADGGGLATLKGWNGPSERGIVIHAISSFGSATNTSLFDQLRSQVEAGILTLRVADVMPAPNAADAHRRLAAGGVRGRLVLDFSQPL